MAEFKDTVEQMLSDDYQQRLKAEYAQTKIRYENLDGLLIKHEAGTLPFALRCDPGLLASQKYHMEEYLRILRVRAEIEGIKL